MRKVLGALILLMGGLAIQPALAAWGGHWVDAGYRENRRMPPPPPPRMQRPPPPPPQMRAPPPQMQMRGPQQFGAPRMEPNQAAQRAQMLNGGGRVLAVDPAEGGYRVRVLKEGEVRSVYVPQ